MDTEMKKRIAAAPRQVESAVIKAPIGKIWELLKCFKFEELFPSSVSKTEFVKGSPCVLGSMVKVTFKDGSYWTYCINELSDVNYRMSFELIESEPKCLMTSALNCLKLNCVTDDNSTFIEWETDFSNDADLNVIEDNKFKKIDYFKDLKKTCTC